MAGRRAGGQGEVNEDVHQPHSAGNPYKHHPAVQPAHWLEGDPVAPCQLPPPFSHHERQAQRGTCLRGPWPTHLGGDMEGPVPAHGDLLLHHAEAVEPAEQEAGAVHPQVEVHVVAQEPARNQRRGQVPSDAAHMPSHTLPAPGTWSVHPGAGDGQAHSCPTDPPLGRHGGGTNKKTGQAVVRPHQGS